MKAAEIPISIWKLKQAENRTRDPRIKLTHRRSVDVEAMDAARRDVVRRVAAWWLD